MNYYDLAVMLNLNYKYRRSDDELRYFKVSAGKSEPKANVIRHLRRVDAFLNFKWSEVPIPISEVTPLFPVKPMYHTRTGMHGGWFMFRKEDLC